MANLPDQLLNGDFSNNPALEKALQLAPRFLSRRFDVYKTLDDVDSDLNDVEDHVRGENLPPVVVNPRTALRVSDNDRRGISASIHCDTNSDLSLRERTHLVERFTNVHSDVGIVVSMDEGLVNELKRVSNEKEKQDVTRRLLICYAAICYLHEVAHTTVAAFLNKDRSLTARTPETCLPPSWPMGQKPEAGLIAEYLILGCFLETKDHLVTINKDAKNIIDGISVCFLSGASRKINIPFVEHVEAVLSGHLTFKGKTPEMLENEAREILGCPSSDEVTPKEAEELLMSYSNKWKSSCSPRSDHELPSYSSPAPKSLHVHSKVG